MSMAPVPGTILDLTAALNQGLQTRQPFDSTLAQALNVLVDSWPDVQAARVFWPSGTEAASTDDTAAALSGASELEAPIYNDGHWLIPLRDDAELLGVLEVTGILPDDADWLQLVALSLVQAITRQHSWTLDLFRHELNDARDILAVLHTLRPLVPAASQFSRAAVIYHNQQIQDLVVTHTLHKDQEDLVSISVREGYGADVIQAMTDFPAADACLFLASNPTDESQSSSTVVMPFFEGDLLREIIRVDYASTQPLNADTRRLLNAARTQVGVVLHALRLVNDVKSSAALLEQQVPVLRLLSELSTVISITKDEHQLLNQSAQAFVEVLQADYCRVYLLDATNRGGTIFCEYPNRGTSGKPFAFDDLPIAHILDTDNPMPVVVNNVQADLRVSEGGRARLQAEGVRAFVLMPLFVRGRLTSLFRLDITREDHHFTPELQDLMQTVLAQVVVGLQNIRLLEDAQQNSDQLHRANQFGQTLQSTLDMEVILRAALTESHRVIPVERMSIALKDINDSRLREVAFYANNENTITLMGGAEVQLENSIMGEVWETQQPAHIPDATENNPLADDGLKSMLILPLIARGDALGIVLVEHGQAYIYNETDVIVFQQMMVQFAAAVENARLFEESQHIAQRAALINEIGSRLQTTTSVEHTLNEAARGLQQALNAGRVSIRLGGPPVTQNDQGV